MKLHVLEIQAFGPFAKKEVIDFSELGENSLFLIDGPTGAGKSSILHAICYALYGETTDSDRKELGLRCDHAEADLLTELSLEFSIRGDQFRITRVPTQMRPSKRGGGETEQKSTAHLRRVLDDGEEETLVAKKTRDADTKIEEIVGLTSEQFLQVMVLPQGKFRELLLAKSDDRQEILSTLFQTQIYKRIEDLLKLKAGEIEKQNKAFEDRKSDAYLDVHVADSDVLEKSIEEAVDLLEAKRKDKESASDKKQQATTDLKAAEELGKSFANRNSKQKDLEGYVQKSEDINADKVRIENAGKAASIEPKWNLLQRIVKDISDKKIEISQADGDKEKANLNVENANNAVDKATEEYQQRDSLKAEESKFNGYLDKLTSYQALKKASSKASKKHETAVNNKLELEIQYKNVERALATLQGEIELLEQASANKADIVEKKLLAKSRYDKRVKLEAARSELVSFNEAYGQEKEKFDSADNLYKQLEQDANRVEMQWFSSQVAVLAAKLEEDQPCSVCGSIDHPNPAHFATDSLEINQDAVDQSRDSQDKQLEVMNAIKEKLQGCLHSVTSKEKEINGLEIELTNDANKPVADVEKVYRELEANLKTIEEKEQELLKAKKLKGDKENELSPIADDIKAIDDKLPELTKTKTRAETELESANNTLPTEYRNSEAIDKVLTQIRQKITKVEKTFQAANNAQTNCLKKQSSIEASVIELNKSLNELESRNEEQSELWRQALAESEFATQQAFESAQMESDVLNVLVRDVREHDKAVAALQTEIGLLDEQLKDKQLPDIGKLQQTLNELSDAFASVEALWTTANQQHKKLIDTRDKVEQIEAQQVEIKKQYEVVGTLSKAASGRGNVRVSLERFVLGNILDQVLSIASQRLYIMSKGQYRLIRQNEEDQKRNTTAGLDLAIDDAYTGKTRPVATLSGGESFMASLALALGLSDVVQERSGGIQLDTLFIDEGFGSLDQDSLQLAINTLIDLQSTGRTIGIISHVSELKEQMSQRVEVTGSRSGSTIKLVA